MRVSPAEFLALDLEVHALLRDVPLRDVTAIDLPGVVEPRTLADVKRRLAALRQRPRGVDGALVRLRRWIGRRLDWDQPQPEQSSDVRLPDDLRRRSLVPPGTRDGPFQLLYELPYESLGELRNATVHAFACMALAQRSSGYRFYLAVYVEAVSRFTPIYMAAIEPFRRFIVYPAMGSRLRAAWEAALPQN